MKTILNSAGSEYLRVMKELFAKYKNMGDKTFSQLDEKDFHYKIDEESNSIAIIIQHIGGNMVSRFRNFLTSDGEKSDRNRDNEFEEQNLSSKDLINKWEQGWKIFFSEFDKLRESDLTKVVMIRNEPHSVIEALDRQATHYAYHIGQIVFIAKHIKKENWKTLSIPKGKSAKFNKEMFSSKLNK